MIPHFPYLWLLAASALHTGGDPVLACRAAHGDDPPAHIACLEEALRERQAAKPSTAAAFAGATGLGAEQVRAAQRQRDARPPAMEVEIVSATYDAKGLGLFRMADGQVWRETVPNPPNQRLQADRTYKARIERGKLGGYRMYVEGVRRMLKVQRVE